MTPALIQGDAAQVLARDFAERSIDMVYSDPPFGNGLAWTGKAGAFSDRWTVGEQAERGWAALADHNPHGADLARTIATTENGRGYLGMMSGLLLQVRRVLKHTGSLWLHFDDTFGAELRILCDVIFGPENALGLLIWKRSDHHSTKAAYGRVHDQIAVYGRARAAQWRLARVGDRSLVYGDPCERVFVDGLLTERLNSGSKERVGYPTQKPVALIERFIRAATLPGDVVLDPTCGSGTTLVAATNLGRQAIGIDMSSDAIAAAHGRLNTPSSAQADLFGAAA